MKRSGKNEKAVLIITTHFPPISNVASIRFLKMTQYCEDFGWRPVILTTKTGYEKYYDDSLITQVPSSTLVYRTREIDFRRYLERRERKAINEAEAENTTSADTANTVKYVNPTIRRILKRISDCIFIPDHKIGWLPFALFWGIKAVKTENIKLIFASYAPATSLLVAFTLKLLCHKKLVVEFRDPWARKTMPEHSLVYRERIEAFLEKLVIKKSDAVVFTTEPLRREYAEHYDLQGILTRVISNGGDPRDFEKLRSVPNHKNFVLTHSGKLYGSRNPSAFLRAFAQFVQENRLTPDDVTVNFVGQFDDPGITSNRRLVRELNLNSYMNIAGYVSYKRNLEYLLSSDVLLLITHVKGSDNVCPAKLFEYLFAGKYILALTTDPIPIEIITKANAGCIVPPDDVRAISHALNESWQKFRQGNLHTKYNEDYIQQFDRRKLVGDFCAFWDSLI